MTNAHATSDIFPKGNTPASNHIYVTPRLKPQLKQFIKYMLLNCVEKKITLDVGETPDFSAFDWLSNINTTRASLLKSPFCDLEQDALVIEFKDENDKPLAVITLRGLELVHHECEAGRAVPLSHKIIINYDKIKMLQVEEDEQVRYDLSTEDWMKEKFDLPPHRIKK